MLRVLGLIGTRPAGGGLTSGFRMLAEYDGSQTRENVVDYAKQLFVTVERLLEQLMCKEIL